MGQSAFGEEQQGAIKWTALRVARPVGAGMREVCAPRRWCAGRRIAIKHVGPQIGHDNTSINELVIHVGSPYSWTANISTCAQMTMEQVRFYKRKALFPSVDDGWWMMKRGIDEQGNGRTTPRSTHRDLLGSRCIVDHGGAMLHFSLRL